MSYKKEVKLVPTVKKVTLEKEVFEEE